MFLLQNLTTDSDWCGRPIMEEQTKNNLKQFLQIMRVTFTLLEQHQALIFPLAQFALDIFKVRYWELQMVFL